MKRTKQEYRDFYYQCMGTGELPRRNGLCTEFMDDELFDLLTPTEENRRDLVRIYLSSAYWGYELESGRGFGADYTYLAHRLFTPLRQTIVLFMAEMADDS